MILNDFLNIKLGVEFEDKYNALTVKEVIENKEEYPLIIGEIESQVENAEDTGIEWDYDSSYFDCDDDEFCAGYDETMELYRAFVYAFAKDMQNKPLNVKYASFGLDYLEQANTHNVLDPLYHYLGMTYISVFPKRTELGREVFYPAVSGKAYLGVASTEKYNRTFSADNEEVLKNVANGFKVLFEGKLLFANRFDNDGLAEHSVKLESGEVGHPCDCYEIRIGDNLLRFFSTERGFDALAALRFPIMESLTEDQHKNDIAQTINNID